jgi:hypothetical protein
MNGNLEKRSARFTFKLTLLGHEDHVRDHFGFESRVPRHADWLGKPP